MKTTNMGGGKRACAFVLVLLVNFQLICAKPFFGFNFWCDLLCDDDDDVTTTSTTTTLDDLLDALFDPCSDCPTRRPTTPRTPTPNPGMMPPFNVMIPPGSNGMNVTMMNTGGGYFMQMFPWGAGPATPAPATTAAPAAPAAAAATPAAAGATTPAAGATNATTAATPAPAG